ncbi:protein of unknown function [Pararobbsia alpina]
MRPNPDAACVPVRPRSGNAAHRQARHVLRRPAARACAARRGEPGCGERRWSADVSRSVFHA